MTAKFKYPLAKTLTAVDLVVFTIENDLLKTVLIERTEEPFSGLLALPGGFLWEGETTAEATVRILKTKVGVTDVFFEQLYTFDSPGRDPRGRVIAVSYFALVPIEKIRTSKLKNSIVIKSVSAKEGLAFDHDKILTYALKRLRTKLIYTNIAYSLLPELFTLTELQAIYEVILGKKIDKRNFRKKILSLDVVTETKRMVGGKQYRPARLYKFKERTPMELVSPAF